ncbi:GmrSD restriction endonuclease domain-containing protein [Geodermatophilus normandii]|uniref:HNH endonuclease n=1 Tax=Geodermatophilus normandii TaxID=1137989 RepID=A0A6P0GA14_9ACTN|nr:HNH endonuclease [Geodermatophilus normandii]
MPLRPVPLRAAVALVLAAALTSGCAELLGDQPPIPPAGSALEALDSVQVRGRAPQTGYSRDQFGSGWVDTDHNGCDTRNDVLARDLTGEVFEPGTRDCVVETGTLADPYSGRTIEFRRGEGTSEAVQIDHVVPLSDAWQKGAQQWDADRRTEFANDPLNLLAVDGPLNQSKGDSDAATWLPPTRSYRCAYVARQVAVKVTYGLWMTRAERDAVAGVLGTCPDEPLPSRDRLPAQQLPATVPPTPVTPYPDCAAVRAAGAAPIREGDPGWNPALDGDGDGDGCEG